MNPPQRHTLYFAAKLCALLLVFFYWPKVLPGLLIAAVLELVLGPQRQPTNP